MNKRQAIKIWGILLTVTVCISAGLFVLSAHALKNYTGVLATTTKEAFYDTLKNTLKNGLHTTAPPLDVYGYTQDFFSSLLLKPFLTITSCLLLLETLFYWSIYGYSRRKNKRVIRAIVRDLEASSKAPLCFDTYSDDCYNLLTDALVKNVHTLRRLKLEAEKAHRMQTENLEDIAHQIKTPITSLSMMVELLREDQLDSQMDLLCRLDEQLDRLNQLTSGLLALSSLSSPNFIFKKETITLGDVFRRINGTLSLLAADKGIVLNLPFNDDAPLVCDVKWTVEAFTNLVKNAIEHSPPLTEVAVHYEETPLYHAFKIVDSGNGFTKEDLPHVFKRFYKGNGAKKHSIGIGLSIAKAVFEGQDAQIVASNEAGHGVFTIRWFKSLEQLT